ncbi:MAG: hypothetical protein IPL98_14985 [Saprospiraceae bacterium]|nr:hypothetical protein [Saprospiraceae bacterium]
MIHSNQRFFEEVQEILDRKESDFAQEINQRVKSITKPYAKLRLQHGAIIRFESESRFKLLIL